MEALELVSDEALRKIVRKLDGRGAAVRHSIRGHPMKSHGNVPRIECEVRIGREDGEPSAVCRGTDQEIDRPTRHPLAPAEVEEAGRLLVVAGRQEEVVEVGQAVAESLEILVGADPREDLLADRADQPDPAVPHQRRPLLDDSGFGGSEIASAPPQRERPDRGVRQYAQPRLRRRSAL